MWELAVIAGLVLLMVLILLVVACWISSNNQSRKNRRHIRLLEARLETGLATLQAAQTICCTKAFLTVVGGMAVDRMSGLLKVIAWDSQAMNELPANGWTPVYSNVDGSLIGWTVPLSGTYFVEYETLIATSVAASLVVVNGQVLLRSLAATANTLTSPQLDAAPLQKSFLVNLSRNDIVSIIIVNFVGAGITPPLETGGPGRFLHTLSLDLRDASSQSVDPGLDAAPGPPVLAPDDVANNPATKQLVSPAQNVEQWAAADCVQQALSAASVSASQATTTPDQLAVIDSTLRALNTCGAAT
jgi:hypothetical protein